MGCCSPFNAVAGSAVADLSRHVNYTNGMILGADDYSQEFAYHAARDQWITRETLGYGTLSGLAVDVEADGKKGPRIRVTAGSAAAPSGQLICVGRDQCGSLNPWLADPKIADQVGERAARLTPFRRGRICKTAPPSIVRSLVSNRAISNPRDRWSRCCRPVSKPLWRAP